MNTVAFDRLRKWVDAGEHRRWMIVEGFSGAVRLQVEDGVANFAKEFTVEELMRAKTDFLDYVAEFAIDGLAAFRSRVAFSVADTLRHL